METHNGSAPNTRQKDVLQVYWIILLFIQLWNFRGRIEPNQVLHQGVLTVTTDVQIEAARDSDIEVLVEQWLSLAEEQRAHGSHVLVEPNRKAIRDTLVAHQYDDGLFVARLSGEIAGFVSVSVERGMFALDRDRGFLSNLYVRPPYREQGIGSALLARAESTLSKRGVDTLVLEALADNEPARRFYRKNGYETFRVAMSRGLEESDENDTHSKEER